MTFFSGRSESHPHEVRRQSSDPYLYLIINGNCYRVIQHHEGRTWKVRLDTRDVAKLNAKSGDSLNVGDDSVAWTVKCLVPTFGGVWFWLER